jgi:hypothetical protein
MVIHGKCHCGNVSFALAWEPDPAEIRARECGCRFCRKHGGVWTSHPVGRLRIAIAEPRLLNRYAFGSRTAEFLVCARCGIVPVVTSNIDGHTYAVVSVNAFENVDPALIRRSGADFEGEGTDDRLARRKRNWIAHVVFEPAARTD